MNKLHPDPAVRAAQLRAREWAGVKSLTQPDPEPKIERPNYATMPIEELTALVAKAENWLKHNKGHQNYESSKKRYVKIAHFLAIRTNMQ